MDLELSEHAHDGHTVVALRGELDLTSASRLRDYLFDILTSQPGSLVLDLSALAFMDSSGLNALVAADQRARQLGVTLVLAAPQKIVARVFRLTSLDQHFTIYPTAADAADRVGPVGGQDQAGAAGAPA